MTAKDPKDYTFEEFVSVVERSFLPPAEKEQLKQFAAAGSINKELWSKFDDLLVAALEERKQLEYKYKSQLDTEIQRYTEEYESEKRIMDQQMREDLKQCEKLGDAEAQVLWDEYYRRISQLQNKVLNNLRRTSKTMLQRVAVEISGEK